MKLIKVSEDDLKSVTGAILDNWHKEITTFGGWERHYCRFCGNKQAYNFETNEIKKPDHKLDCPVLIAISIRPQ